MTFVVSGHPVWFEGKKYAILDPILGAQPRVLDVEAQDFADDETSARLLAWNAVLDSLRTADEAAVIWGVSVRRARAHIAALHARLGIGRPIRGEPDGKITVWLLTEDEIRQNPPGRSGRPAKQEA